MDDTAADNPPTGTPGAPNPPHRANAAPPTPAPRRRRPRAPLVALAIAAVVLLLVAAGFVRLTEFVGVIQRVSTPAALGSATTAGDGGILRHGEPRAGVANPGTTGGAAADAPHWAAARFAAAPDSPAPAAPGTDDPARRLATPAPAGADPGGIGSTLLGGFAADAGQTVAGIASAAGVGDAHLQPLTILLMGVDARAGEPIDIGVRPDAMALLRLDPATGACRMLAIPRDTRTELPGYGLSKVNHALAVGGVPYQRRVVEGLLGLPIDRFVLVDLRAVEEVVEIVGGVTLDVPEAFVAADGTPIEAGAQTLDGRQVLAYVQYRGGPDGDLGRIRRQQQVLRALLAKATDLDVLPTLANLLPVLEGHLRTDLAPAEIVGLAQRFRGSCTPDSLSVAMLDGTTATFDDPLVRQPLSYVVIDPAEIAREREWLLASDAA